MKRDFPFSNKNTKIISKWKQFTNEYNLKNYLILIRNVTNFTFAIIVTQMYMLQVTLYL